MKYLKVKNRSRKLYWGSSRKWVRNLIRNRFKILWIFEL